MVLLLVIYLAFRYYFHPESAEESTGTVTHKLDTAEIEKTLQKILEAQNKAPAVDAVTVTPTPAAPAPTAPVEVAAPLEGAGASVAANQAELEKLKAELAEKERLIAQAREEAARAAALVAATSGAPGGNAEEQKKLEGKVKDLEARLAEYEIISEDIADLSFYKEENIRLQNELTALRGGGPVAAAAAPVAPAPAAEAAATAPAPTQSEDEIMKEFAKAVEEQKPATVAAAPDAPKAEGQETAELMNQFENFVKKD